MEKLLKLFKRARIVGWIFFLGATAGTIYFSQSIENRLYRNLLIVYVIIAILSIILLLFINGKIFEIKEEINNKNQIL